MLFWQFLREVHTYAFFKKSHARLLIAASYKIENIQRKYLKTINSEMKKFGSVHT